MADPRSRLWLHVVQAAFGDCLVVEARTGARTRWILIDGGPSGNYAAHLRPVLASIAAGGGTIEVAVLSHIDNDHVTGLLDLYAELRNPVAGADGLPRIGGLWHNSFAQAVGDADLVPAVRAALRAVEQSGSPIPSRSMVLRGVAEGDALRADALAFGTPLNAGFAQGEVLVDGQPPIRLGGLTVHVVGPSRKILDELRQRWMEWLAAHRARITAGEPIAVAPDQSIPNLSSIALLVELDGKSLLLTGDARADQVLAGMAEAGQLGGDGRRHVSVLKMPHHGSIRNVNAEFLHAVTADVYVISADGRYGNPDYEALALIVDAAHEDGRPIELAMTNVTPSSEQLLKSHPPAEFGYTVRTLDPGANELPIEALAGPA